MRYFKNVVLIIAVGCLAAVSWRPAAAQNIRVEVVQSLSGQSLLAWNAIEFVRINVESDRDFQGYFTLDLEIHGIGNANVSSQKINFTTGNNTFSNLETNFLNGQISNSLQKVILRTGKFPGCVFTFRVELYEGNPPAGSLLNSDSKEVTEDCETDTDVPPELVYPAPGDVIIETEPVFIWNSSNYDQSDVFYRVRVCEKPDWQSAEKAIQSPALFEEEIKGSGSGFVIPLQMKKDNPLESEKLVNGRSYVWQVTALDENNQPVGSTSGKTEIGLFTINVNAEEKKIELPVEKPGEQRKIIETFEPKDKLDTKVDLFLGLVFGSHVFSLDVNWKDKLGDVLFYMIKLSEKENLSSVMWKELVKAKGEGRLSASYPESAEDDKLLPGIQYYLVIEAYNKKNKIIQKSATVKFVPSSD